MSDQNQVNADVVNDDIWEIPEDEIIASTEDKNQKDMSKEANGDEKVVKKSAFSGPRATSPRLMSRPAAANTTMSDAAANNSVSSKTDTSSNSGASSPALSDQDDPDSRSSDSYSAAAKSVSSRPAATRVVAPKPAAVLEELSGFLDTTSDNHAVVRATLGTSRRDAYVHWTMIRKMGLRPGDFVVGTARPPREGDRYWGMQDITTVNGVSPEEARKRRRFEDLVPVYPNEKLVLETGEEPVSNRVIDLVAPIGKGQRGLVVSPPKAGKTTILKDIAVGIATNFPDVHLMAVLIGERPEEVTDIRRHIAAITKDKGEVAASNFDEPAIEQTRIAEVALERAKRLVELGRDVVIVLDSITRLARAYNLAIPTSGRTLSGGFDPAALYPPKRFFGAARNFEVGGSLTIIGTALVDTGSRMDDLVYEEFKGTGNMELHLDRRLAERRIYPAINLQRSGTRRDDLLFTGTDYQNVVLLHRMIDMLNEEERASVILQRMKLAKTNKQFLATLKE